MLYFKPICWFSYINWFVTRFVQAFLKKKLTNLLNGKSVCRPTVLSESCWQNVTAQKNFMLISVSILSDVKIIQNHQKIKDICVICVILELRRSGITVLRNPIWKKRCKSWFKFMSICLTLVNFLIDYDNKNVTYSKWLTLAAVKSFKMWC